MPAPLHRSPALRVRSASRSHAGCVRGVNEDRVLDRPQAALWAVADGIGGRSRGAEAAERVIEALATIDHGPSGPGFLADIVRALETTNRALHDPAGTSASTVVALLIHGGHHACVWAGDSRAYRLRAGRLDRITSDHSIVQQMVDRGTLSESERRHHPGSNVITRAVGAGPQLRLDRHSAAVTGGDIFLLCSDGLPACVEEAEIAAWLGAQDIAAAADGLLALALERGAPDNVSLVLVSLSDA